MSGNEDNKEREERLDKILDGALARYNHVEPRAGLEDRILANLRTQPQRARSNWWGWSWNWNSMTFSGAAVAGLVLIVLALFLSPWRRQEPQVAPNIADSSVRSTPQRTDSAPAPTGVVAVARPVRSVAKQHGTKSNTVSGVQQEAAAVPHQAVFPSPAAPSEQERMLLSYVHRTPKEILVAVSEEQQQHEQEWLEQMNQLQKSAPKSGSL